MLSPNVQTTEQDFSKSIQAPETNVVGYAGFFKKGTPFERVRISNEKELVNTYGEPDDDTYKHFFTVQNILQYGNAVDVVRVCSDGTEDGVISATNAGLTIDDTGAESSSGVDQSAYIDDKDNYTASFEGTEQLKIYAKNPGTWGNDYKVAIANYADFSTANIVSGTSFASEFDIAPTASDELAIAVLDSDDTILETFIVSLTENDKNANGRNYFIEEYINNASNYIIAYLKSDVISIPSIEATTLSDGVNGDAPSDSLTTDGYNLFADKDNVDINYLISGGNETDVIRKLLNTIATSRKDIMSYIAPKYDDIVGISNNSTIVSNLTTDVETLAINSSYTAYFGNYFYVYDNYNDKYRWLSPTGEIVGMKLETNANNSVWFANAGFTRGIITNAYKLAFSPNLSQRDTLYKNRINPVYNDKGSGFVLLGQKTLLNSSSSFNRINVRELFIYIEKAIEEFAKEYLFEFNDVTTRTLFKNAVDQFLNTVVADRGISNFSVICDDTNNTATVLDNNEFIADIKVKPNTVAEFIKLNFFNVGQSVDFSEVV